MIRRGTNAIQNIDFTAPLTLTLSLKGRGNLIILLPSPPLPRRERVGVRVGGGAV